jgi:hypothetical protein
MSQLDRHCPGCDDDRLFEQYHGAECPDTPDGYCQEWACTECGTALIIGFISPASAVSAGAGKASAVKSRALGQPGRAA